MATLIASPRSNQSLGARLLAGAALLLYGLSLHAQTVVPVSQEPHHHLLVSNEYVRAYAVEVEPHSETLYHQHDYDYIYVTIGDADVTSTRINEKPVRLNLKDGQVNFSKGGFAHKAADDGPRPFRNVTVELLKGGGDPICGFGGKDRCGVGSGGAEGASAGLGAGWSESAILMASRVDVSRVEMQGRSSLPNCPCLIVATAPLHLKAKSQSGTINELDLDAGQFRWLEDPRITLTNNGEKVSFISVAFSPEKQQ